MLTPLRHPNPLRARRAMRGLLACGAIVGIAALGTGCGSGDDSSAGATEPSFNVTLSAADGRLSTDRSGTLRLVLRGVSPRVEVADVSPGTSRTWAPTWVWARSWKRLYAGYQPNTTISWGEGRSRGRTSVALVNGRYQGRNMVFEVRPLAAGTPGPLPAVAAPRQVRDLGPVEVFVDPALGLPAASFVSQELSDAAGMQFSSTPWNSATSRPIVPALPGGQGYSQITAMPGQVVLLELQGNVGFGTSNLPGRTIVPVNPDFVGGYFVNFTLTNGAVNLGGGPNQAFVGNNAFINLDLTGGKLIPPSSPHLVDEPTDDTNYFQDLLDGEITQVPGSGDAPDGQVEVPTGNTFIRANLTNAQVANGFLGDSVFAGPTLSGTSWGSGVTVRGSVFLGADFSGVTYPGGSASFAGATFAPFNAPSPDGAVTTNSSFAGANLGTQVSFGESGGVAGAVLMYVDFTGSGLQGTSFEGATITSGGTGTPGFANANLGSGASANFDGASLTNVDFTGATMGGASFEKAALAGATFAGATFGSDTVSFQGATLNQGTTLPGTLEPAQASFAGTVFDGASFSGSPSPQLIAAVLTQAADTKSGGVQMGGTTYMKQGGTIYQVQGSQWQPLELQGAALVPNGDPVPAGGGNAPPDPNPDPNPQPPDPNPQPPDPNPQPDNAGGGGGSDDPVAFGGSGG